MAPPPGLLQLSVALRDGPREIAREDVDDVEVAALGGVVERRLAVAVGSPRVCAGLEQQPRSVGASLARRVVERREAELVRDVDAAAGLEQRDDHCGRLPRSRVQRGLSVVLLRVRSGGGSGGGSGGSG